jgi:hypothetical protein
MVKRADPINFNADPFTTYQELTDPFIIFADPFGGGANFLHVNKYNDSSNTPNTLKKYIAKNLAVTNKEIAINSS